MVIRQSVLFAALLVVIVGCDKPAPTTANDEKPSGKPSEAPKPDAGETYTLKIREKTAGGKYEITHILTLSELVSDGQGKGKPPKMSVEKTTGKNVYTEEVEEIEDGLLTKGKRTYTTAEGLQYGKVLPLSYAGKTVLIERKADKSYSFTLADGKPVGPDAVFLNLEFDRNRAKNTALLIPNTPVKVGEVWNVAADKIKAVYGPVGETLKATGKLVKVYTKDGKQYGVLTLNLETPPGEFPKGTIEWTYDGCIDGSTTDCTRKAVQTMQVPGKGEKLPDFTNVNETTIKQVK